MVDGGRAPAEAFLLEDRIIQRREWMPMRLSVFKNHVKISKSIRGLGGDGHLVRDAHVAKWFFIF